MASLATQADVDRLVKAGAPEVVLAHPGMISPEERSFLYNVVQQTHREGSIIVDAGVFLGASTRTICEALRAQGINDSPVHSFEYGIFNANTAKAASRMLRQDFEEGRVAGHRREAILRPGLVHRARSASPP
jgi:predicted O-methyltransferase YrrM